MRSSPYPVGIKNCSSGDASGVLRRLDGGDGRVGVGGGSSRAGRGAASREAGFVLAIVAPATRARPMPGVARTARTLGPRGGLRTTEARVLCVCGVIRLGFAGSVAEVRALRTVGPRAGFFTTDRRWMGTNGWAFEGENCAGVDREALDRVAAAVVRERRGVVALRAAAATREVIAEMSDFNRFEPRGGLEDARADAFRDGRLRAMRFASTMPQPY